MALGSVQAAGAPRRGIPALPLLTTVNFFNYLDRQVVYSMTPFLAEGRYVNYLDDDEAQRGSDPVRAAYGVNYERLVDVKTTYDPDNVFHLNYNILPRAKAS